MEYAGISDHKLYLVTRNNKPLAHVDGITRVYSTYAEATRVANRNSWGTEVYGVTSVHDYGCALLRYELVA